MEENSARRNHILEGTHRSRIALASSFPKHSHGENFLFECVHSNCFTPLRFHCRNAEASGLCESEANTLWERKAEVESDGLQVKEHA